MRVLLTDKDGSLRIVSALCVEYDADSQMCRVIVARGLLYCVSQVSQSEYNLFITELYERGFSSLTEHEIR